MCLAKMKCLIGYVCVAHLCSVSGCQFRCDCKEKEAHFEYLVISIHGSCIQQLAAHIA